MKHKNELSWYPVSLIVFSLLYYKGTRVYFFVALFYNTFSEDYENNFRTGESYRYSTLPALPEAEFKKTGGAAKRGQN